VFPANSQVYRQRGFIHCLTRVIPVLLRAQTIPPPSFEGLACYGFHRGLRIVGDDLRSHLFAVAGEEVVTGAQHARAAQMLLNICGDIPLRFRTV
jgi:hypothetical protein